MHTSGGSEGLLGLTAEFDVKSGYLLVEGEGVLGVCVYVCVCVFVLCMLVCWVCV